MRSSQFGVRMPHPVRNAAEQRAAALGYRSLGEYVVGRVRTDLILKPSEDVGVLISLMPRSVQDYIDDRLTVSGPPLIGAQSIPMRQLCEGLIAGLPSHLVRLHLQTQAVLSIVASGNASGVYQQREAA